MLAKDKESRKAGKRNKDKKGRERKVKKVTYTKKSHGSNIPKPKTVSNLINLTKLSLDRQKFPVKVLSKGVTFRGKVT